MNYGPMEMRKCPIPDVSRFQIFDINDPSVENYLSQLAELIKFYGAIPCAGVRAAEPPGYNVVRGPLVWDQHNEPEDGEELSEAQIEEMCEDVRRQARYLCRNGFQMIEMSFAYCCNLPSRFMSSKLNTRSDKFGGSLENRCRFAIMECQAVKEAAPDILLKIIMSGEMEGMTQEETIEFIKMVEPYADVVQIRAETCMLSHPTGFNSQPAKYETLPYAIAMKEADIKAKIEVVGGYLDPDDMERFLEKGYCDLIAMGRAWICNPNLGSLIEKGNKEDIVPCVRCNKCHIQNSTGPWLNVCSVNPKHGIMARLPYITNFERTPKKLAVIGGGPAGMAAALTAVKLGHSVTLYEKTGQLGGQLIHADYFSFKWPLKNYKDWLIGQCEKNGVDIRLNSAPTPGEIKLSGYDAVFAAMGVRPRILPIPGIESEKVWPAQSVPGREKEIGKNVVLIGGSETGVETALYLEENGHNVTVLTRKDTIAPDCDRIHYREAFLDACSAARKLKFIFRAKTVSVEDNTVSYVDEEGILRQIQADTIVVSGGVVPLQDEALAFAECADTFKILGDNAYPRNMQAAIRSGYAASVLL
jgi:2,4-dienoyl-CoA reductase-like NADH-dependent reductase (Old Yellow Enzyme family)/thioredoxin reductase